jgi:KamA family protein
MSARAPQLDIAGIGVGPSNLSLACLADPVRNLRCRFFERSDSIRWHPGLMLREAEIQVSYLKDLVTLVDPTSRFTFLNFLVATGRLFRFAVLMREPVTRREFEAYYRWAAGQLSTIEFGAVVEAVAFAQGAFQVFTESGVHSARHLSIGTGAARRTPAFARGKLGATMFHSSDFLDHEETLAGRKVAVVGGGQSGAEVFAHLLEAPAETRPATLAWVTRRSGFLPLDDSAFTNELFHPEYVGFFQGLSPARRRDLLLEQKVASDGVSMNLLTRIYRRLYENDFVADDPVETILLPARQVIGAEATPAGWTLSLRDCNTGSDSAIDAEIVVLATGYRFRLPECLTPLATRLPDWDDEGLPLRRDYSVPWDGPEANKIFFHNAGRLSHGVADPNLSLAAWRSAVVVNAIAGRSVYATERGSSAVRWSDGAAADDARSASRPPRRETPELRMVSGERLADLPQVQRLDPETRHAMRVVAAVLPFRVNDYVIEELIDWSAVPDDPIFRLTFPSAEMLPEPVFHGLSKLVERGAPRNEITAAVRAWQLEMNPHPGSQREENVPDLDGRPVPGLQHKYRETVLVFPPQGQTCHAYCAYCFRWAQFVGVPELQFSARDAERAFEYLRRHTEVTDVLFTGGDPLLMSTRVLRGWIEPLLSERFAHIRNVRIGTKALAYWPFRVTDGPDADDLLALLAEIAASGRNAALMLHVSHPRELEPEPARKAVRRLLATGASLRAQAPIVRHVNDDASVWAAMWAEMTAMGIHPYYAFVERDTGPRAYFEVPLTRALQIVHDAQREVSGLARTARGPVMSATPGKVVVDGETTLAGERVFALRLLQARDPDLVGHPFFAQWSPSATWLSELTPAFAEEWPWETDRVGSLAGARRAS